MNKGHKRVLTILATVSAVVILAVSPLKGVDVVQASGTQTTVEINSAQDLDTIVTQCSNGVEVKGTLQSSVTVTGGYSFGTGNVTIDLNGFTISGTVADSAIFSVAGGTLVIEDGVGNGKIENKSSSGMAIDQKGGKLTITGGTFASPYVCLNVAENAEAVISGGNFTGTLTALRIGTGCKVEISGSPVFSSVNAAVSIPGDQSGSTLIIDGGTFNATNTGSHSYACDFGGTNNHLTISKGTFNLAGAGSTLVIGSQITDDMVSISGGTFNGRIARMISAGADWDYTTYYGNGSGGILADGYVLTDNAFTDMTSGNTNPEPTVFTANRVEVVRGGIITFDTQRSKLETYADAGEAGKAGKADLYSLAPVSVGADGSMYANSGSTTPVVDATKVTNGNTYTFAIWYDTAGNTYESVAGYVAQKGSAAAGTVLSAGWNAKVSTSAGLANAIAGTSVIKEIEATGNISLTSSAIAGVSAVFAERTLNLGGHTISYAGTDNPAFVLNGAWNIKNGTIESTGQACMQAGGTAVMEGLNCKSSGFSYAVVFSNVAANSQSKIVSGTFEADTYALWATGGTGTATDITNLFKDAYASTSETKTGGSGVYLNAAKLTVSQTPINSTEHIFISEIMSMVQGKAYTLESGQWTVSGDSTVYNGGTEIYVSSDGDYKFTKK